MNQDFPEKAYLVALGAGLSCVFQLCVAVAKGVWEQMGFKRHMHLFACSLENYLINVDSPETEWIAKELISSYALGWRSGREREDFRLLFAIYLFTRKKGYSDSDADKKRKENDVLRIQEIAKRYG